MHRDTFPFFLYDFSDTSLFFFGSFVTISLMMTRPWSSNRFSVTLKDTPIIFLTRKPTVAELNFEIRIELYIMLMEKRTYSLFDVIL